MTKKKNLLDVTQSETLMTQFNEEIAHEFGIHYAAIEQDAKAKANDKKSQKQDEQKESDR
ncbi:hypothetical protein [Geomicrobium sp. JCM 19039]|uniref:hypothetical protein n=1 Tax=Geomicrobium sp. JCM 19039 TaxID=1460636 RepID=UPI00045F2902|nr:hypothetical protein [Geomicrobium sp. JCM 19039]GAK10901.1 hypothetical protein JCM19039_557 [Geomicrobium sp. JCM 19039]